MGILFLIRICYHMKPSIKCTQRYHHLAALKDTNPKSSNIRLTKDHEWKMSDQDASDYLHTWCCIGSTILYFLFPWLNFNRSCSKWETYVVGWILQFKTFIWMLNEQNIHFKFLDFKVSKKVSNKNAKQSKNAN